MTGTKEGDLARDFGRLEGRMIAVERELRDLKTSQGAVARDMSAIKDVLSQAKGGWKTLLLVAGTAGVMGALLAKLGTVVGMVPK